MNLDALVKGIIDYLQSQGELKLLPQLARALEQKASTVVDPNLAVVTTAVALDNRQKSALKEALSLKFKRPVRLKTIVDATLLGGLKIDLGGKVIDTSLSAQLKQLQEAMIYD